MGRIYSQGRAEAMKGPIGVVGCILGDYRITLCFSVSLDNIDHIKLCVSSVVSCYSRAFSNMTRSIVLILWKAVAHSIAGLL